MASPNVQSFIQPIAQGNTPFLANNGNPGTVYNMPNTGSYKPPMASAQNQWALNPNTSQYANDQFWLTQPAANVGGGNPFFNNPGLTTVPGSTIIPAAPGTPQPPTTSNPGGSGNVYSPPGGGGVDRNYPLNGTGSNWTPPSGISNVGTSSNNYTQNAGGNAGSSINWSGGVQGILGSLGAALGMNEGGGMDWQQALDLVLPGDLYNHETGRWNTGNALIAGANAINPALGALVQLAVDNGWGPSALRQRIIDDGLAQANVDLRGTVSDLTGQTRAIMENRTNQTMLDRANANDNAFMPGGLGWNNSIGSSFGAVGSSPFDSDENGNILDRMDSWGSGTPVRDSRSGRSTGSGVMWDSASGESFGNAAAGQSAFFSQLSRQAQDAMTNMFRNARK